MHRRGHTTGRHGGTGTATHMSTSGQAREPQTKTGLTTDLAEPKPCFPGIFVRGAARLRVTLKAELRSQHPEGDCRHKCSLRRSQPALAHPLQQVVLRPPCTVSAFASLPSAGLVAQTGSACKASKATRYLSQAELPCC